MRVLCLGLLALGLFLGTAWADEVVLKNGRSIHGTVKSESDEEVVIILRGGNELRLARSKIQEVRRSSGEREAAPRPTDEPSPPAVHLRWRLRPGRELRFESCFRMELTPAGQAETTGLTEVVTELSLRCVELRARDQTLELAIERTRERKRKDGKETRTDSAAKRPEDRPADTQGIGVPFRVRLSQRGEVLELLQLGQVQVANLEQAQRLELERLVGDYLLRMCLFILLGTFPEDAVRPGGASWEESLLIPGTELGDMQITVNNQVERADSIEAVVVQSGDLTLHGMRGRMLKSSQTRGRLRFSLREGCILEGRQTTRARVDYGTEAQPIPADMTLTLTVKRLVR